MQIKNAAQLNGTKKRKRRNNAVTKSREEAQTLTIQHERHCIFARFRLMNGDGREKNVEQDAIRQRRVRRECIINDLQAQAQARNKMDLQKYVRKPRAQAQRGRIIFEELFTAPERSERASAIHKGKGQGQGQGKGKGKGKGKSKGRGKGIGCGRCQCFT